VNVSFSFCMEFTSIRYIVIDYHCHFITCLSINSRLAVCKFHLPWRMLGEKRNFTKMPDFLSGIKGIYMKYSKLILVTFHPLNLKINVILSISGAFFLVFLHLYFVTKALCKNCRGNIVSCQCFAVFPRVGKH
jgi:hypothetical protein